MKAKPPHQSAPALFSRRILSPMRSIVVIMAAVAVLIACAVVAWQFKPVADKDLRGGEIGFVNNAVGALRRARERSPAPLSELLERIKGGPDERYFRSYWTGAPFLLHPDEERWSYLLGDGSTDASYIIMVSAMPVRLRDGSEFYAALTAGFGLETITHDDLPDWLDRALTIDAPRGTPSPDP